MDLTLLTCNYSTKVITNNMIRSFENYNPNTSIVVINTSPEGEQFTFPSTYKNISVYDLPNSTHGEGVNYGLGMIKTDYVLLVDSDVIFKQSVEAIFEKVSNVKATLAGNISGNRGGKILYPRVDPWFCFINVKHLKEHNIKFFDPTRTANSRKTSKVYDIGSTLFEDVTKTNSLLVAEFNIEKYIKHYEGMSWRTKKYDPSKGDTDIDFGGTHNNINLFNYGKLVEEQYWKDVNTIW